MGQESPNEVFEALVAAGATALCGGGEELFDMHVTHGEVAGTVLAGAMEAHALFVVPGDAEVQLREAIGGAAGVDGQVSAVQDLFAAWRVGPGTTGDCWPEWAELDEGDQAKVVAFLCAAMEGGFAWAWQNYRPKFSRQSPLHGASGADALGRLYAVEYFDMPEEEFWRLLELSMERGLCAKPAGDDEGVKLNVVPVAARHEFGNGEVPNE